MGKAIRASALVLLLACSAYAGEMQNDVKQPAPPPPQEATADGYMQTGLTDTVLNLLGSVFALL